MALNVNFLNTIFCYFWNNKKNINNKITRTTCFTNISLSHCIVQLNSPCATHSLPALQTKEFTKRFSIPFKSVDYLGQQKLPRSSSYFFLKEKKSYKKFKNPRNYRQHVQCFVVLLEPFTIISSFGQKGKGLNAICHTKNLLEIPEKNLAEKSRRRKV